MIAYLQGSGFLDTKAGLGSDLSLVIMLAAAVMLTTGVVLARRRRYGPHRWVQTAAVCLNLVPVVAWMIRFFWLYVAPALPGALNKGSYALATIHAAVGALGVALGVFIVIRANQLEARGQSLSRYKTAMRIAYVLYMLGVALGIALYVVTYG
jgi:uncharacterized membrane protein YozB (DUF420 family)